MLHTALQKAVYVVRIRSRLPTRLPHSCSAATIALTDDHCIQNGTLPHVGANAPDADKSLKPAIRWNWSLQRRKLAGHNLTSVFRQERVTVKEGSIPLHGSFETPSVAQGIIFVYAVHVPNILLLRRPRGPNPVGLRAFGLRLLGEFRRTPRFHAALRSSCSGLRGAAAVTCGRFSTHGRKSFSRISVRLPRFTARS